MARDFIIMTDSCCDLPQSVTDELGVVVLPLTVFIGENSYKNYLDGREIDPTDFYRQVRAGSMPTTSAVSVGDFEDAMRTVLAEGKDILCLNFSSALSTTYQSACIAARELTDEFPEAEIRVVDTLSASLGQGLLVYLCARQKAAGRSLAEVEAYAQDTRLHVAHWFTVTDLNHLKRGGRISAATAMFGTMLSIKPVMHMDDGGHLTAVSKVRGRKASLSALVEQMEVCGVAADSPVFISHGDCREEAEAVAADIRARFGLETRIINFVGPVIGAHTGAGVLSIFFLGKGRGA